MSTPTTTSADRAEGCIGAVLRHLAAARDHARGWQLDTLHRAVADELAHPAMAGDDPLTAALRRQLAGADDSVLQGLDVPDVAACCATEGAQPASTAGSGLTPQQWRAMAEAHREGGRGWLWVAGAVLAVACTLMQVYPMGWAS